MKMICKKCGGKDFAYEWADPEKLICLECDYKSEGMVANEPRYLLDMEAQEYADSCWGGNDPHEE